ncbi:unnamed protein product [Oppiella nova]|uniref:ABC transmembrane type-1 domain-containing protein n=1 Tax=Oppiella nova TaxID=334625 RepID=A0A7R9LGS1_9ACAR|nr:unnamed protein product [Oppiella nova]CAG2163514.1 unnamed protein product [Oppiella nova]
MDEEQLIKKPSRWIYQTFIRGLKKEVEITDIYKCPKNDESEQLVQTLERNWNKELRKKNPSFTLATIKTFAFQMLIPFCLILFGECFLKIVQPLLLGWVIRYFADPDNNDYETACLCAGGVVGTSLAYVLTYHPAAVRECRVATKARVTWCTLMYKKALKLKPSAFGKTTIGQILNLMSNDVSRFDEECFLKIVQPLLLGWVIRYFADPDNNDYEMACLCAGGVVGTSLAYVLTYHPAAVRECRVATKARVTWCTLMYKKALKLKPSAFGKTTIGQILNLMSNDVSRFDEALKLKPSAFGKTTIGQILNLMSNDVSRFDEYCILGTYMFIAPLQTLIGIYICYTYIGWTCFIGLGVLLLFIPFNSLVGRLFLKIRTKVAALSDNRIRLMNEIIKGMAVIKMYAWEKHFSKLISEARKKEMAKIRGSTLLRALNISISIIAARVILFAIFIVYVLLGGQLKAETVFVTMSIFNTIRNTMTWFFPQSIALAAEIYVSCQRVQRFLLLEEIENQSIEYKDNDFVNEKNKNNMNIYLNNMETI